MYSPREFDLKSVDGLSLRAIHLHLELYKGYVENVNKLLTQIREKGGAADEAAYDVRARRLGFEWNGMVLHEIFFETLRGPGSKIDEKGVFAEALDQSFGGFEPWKRDLIEMASLRGIGWVATVRDRTANRLMNVWIDEHHFGMPAGVRPILLIDLWEHAYLLDYVPSQRGAYVETVLNNIDWAVVESRCTVAEV